jgi:hypothetical protein
MIENIEKEFDEAVDKRLYINTVLWKKYGDLSRAFAFIFNESPATLKKISDMNYYMGGYPSENTPPKIQSLFQAAGLIAKYFSAIGRLDQINEYLNPYGFKLSLIEAPQFPVNRPNGTEAGLTVRSMKVATDAGLDLNKSPVEIINWFIGETEVLQREICQEADKIKIGIFGSVVSKLENVDKSGFTKAVNRSAAKRYRRNKHKSTDGVVKQGVDMAKILHGNGSIIEEAVTKY